MRLTRLAWPGGPSRGGSTSLPGRAVASRPGGAYRLRRGATGFFFQAEDGIRGYKVTGVQTCALPIWVEIHANVIDTLVRGDRIRPVPREVSLVGMAIAALGAAGLAARLRVARAFVAVARSGERRVGEEGRSPWGPYHLKKKNRHPATA